MLPYSRRQSRDPELRLIQEIGEWGGPTYDYRGGRVWTNAAGDRWQIWIEEHPLRGLTLRSLRRAIVLIDAWVEGRHIPPP